MSQQISGRARPSSNRLALLWLLFSLFVFTSSALADLVHLTNGKVIQGEVIEENEKYIIVRVPYGQIKLQAQEVDFVERQTSQEYRLDLGRDFLRQRKYVQALEELEKARAADTDSTDAQQALHQACLQYGQHLIQVNRLGEAKKYFNRALVLKPDSKEGKEGLAAVEAGMQRMNRLLLHAQESAASKDLDAAIAGFMQTLEFSPDARERVAEDLARCLAMRAEHYYKAQRFDEAAEDLERAFGLLPQLANELEGLYAASALSAILQQVQDGRPSELRKAIARVLNFAPTNGLVLYVAGRLEEAQSNWKAAAEYYARCLKVAVLRNSREGVAELRAKAEAALKIPDGGARIVFNTQPQETTAYAQSAPGAFTALETEHFMIFHHNATLAAEAGSVLEIHLARIQAELSLPSDWKAKPKIYLHRTQEEYTLATAQAAWTGGVSRFAHTAKGLVKMEVHSWQTSPRLLKSVVPHEVTHLVVNSNLSAYDELPRALHEGFSILMEPEYRQQFFLQFLRMRLNGKEFIPLSDLLGMKDYPRDPDFFYAEGYCLVSYLARKFSLAKAVDLIRNGPKKAKVEETLLAISGAPSIERLETEWKAWILSGK